jgi:hypothetical protein
MVYSPMAVVKYTGAEISPLEMFSLAPTGDVDVRLVVRNSLKSSN